MAGEHEKQEEVFEDADYDAAFSTAVDDADGAPPVDVAPVEEETVAQLDESEQETESESTISPEMSALEDKLTRMESLLAEAAKRAETAKPVEDAKPAAKTADEEGDDAALAEVAQDWPTIYKAQQAQMKALRAEMAQMMEKVKQEVRGDFAPVTQAVADSAQERFLQTIVTVHPDSKELLPEVEKWIAKQPAFLQTAYNNALDNGSARDVVELYSTFKAQTGRTGKTEQQQQQQSDTKQKRLAQMQGVKSERTSATALDDDDFEGAFNRSAAQN